MLLYYIVIVFVIICGSVVRRGLSTVYFTYYMLHCYQIAAEMNVILVAKDDTRGIINSNWITWQPAIIKYATSSNNKPAALKYTLRDSDGNKSCETDLMLCEHFFLSCRKHDTYNFKAILLDNKIQSAKIQERFWSCCKE